MLLLYWMELFAVDLKIFLFTSLLPIWQIYKKQLSLSAEVSIKNRTHSGKFAGKIFLGFFSRQVNVLFLPLLKHNTYFHLLY